MLNKEYHKYFNRTDKLISNHLNEIPISVIREVRQLIKSGFFKDNEITKFEKLINLKSKLIKIYNVKYCDIKIYCNSFPKYISNNKTIILDNYSLVTFFHEFRHHLQYELNLKCDKEKDARGWSHSLFFLATPKLFENALNKDLLIWQKEGLKNDKK